MPTLLPGLNGWGLNLGCGGRPEEGWANHDQTRHSPYVDVAWNLECREWPKLFEDAKTGRFLGSIRGAVEYVGDSTHHIEFARIKARDVLEHIPPNLFFVTMDNIWKYLRPEGELEVQVPEWGSPNAIIDPTHWRGFHLDSFDILDPETKIGRHNKFYGNKPWKLLSKLKVPKSTTNLCFTLQKPK